MITQSRFTRAALVALACVLVGPAGATANHVRFIWFSAEESGLIGSQYYVDQLSDAQLDQIAAMLNFDMVASPNFARFVYDGTTRRATRSRTSTTPRWISWPTRWRQRS